MTFHVILGMWMDDWGYELSETFRVTPQGAECFCDVERVLFKALAKVPADRYPTLAGGARKIRSMDDPKGVYCSALCKPHYSNYSFATSGRERGERQSGYLPLP
jgi:hypothetical protein